jgi:multiple sugar transport system permease protein
VLDRSTPVQVRAMRRWRRAGAYAVLLVVSILTLVPFLWVVTTALKSVEQIFAVPPQIIPHPFVWSNFQLAIQSSGFGLFLRNSLVVATVCTILSLVVAVPAAYGFARFRYRGSGGLLAGIVTARMFPPIALVVPFFLLFRSLHLVNTIPGLIVAYLPLEIPLIVWILEGFFEGVPRELEEAGVVDGLSTLGVLWRIVVPLARPSIAVAALFGYLAAWNEFVLALTLTQTTTAETLPIGIARYITSFQTYWGQMSAAAVFYLAPVLVFTVIAQRGIVRGLTEGGTKG